MIKIRKLACVVILSLLAPVELTAMQTQTTYIQKYIEVARKNPRETAFLVAAIGTGAWLIRRSLQKSSLALPTAKADSKAIVPTSHDVSQESKTRLDRAVASSFPSSATTDNVHGLVDPSIIAKSPHQIPSWENPLYTSDEQHAIRTQCARSAEYVIQLATGIKDIQEQTAKIVIGSRLFPSHNDSNYVVETPTEYWGTFGNFVKKDSSLLRHTNGLAQKLFMPSDKAEHSFFYVDLAYGAHVVAIEKQSDGTSTWWRLYQSYYKYFTLAEWLGLPENPWRLDRISEPDIIADIYTQLFKEYGHYKKLSSEQITKAIARLVEDMADRLKIILPCFHEGTITIDEKALYKNLTLPLYIRAIQRS